MKRPRCFRPVLCARSATSRAAFVAIAWLAAGAAVVACSSSDETQRPSIDRGSGGGAGSDAAPGEAGANGASDGATSDDASSMADVSLVVDAGSSADADASSAAGDAAMADIRSEPPADARANDTASSPPDVATDSRADAPGDTTAERPADAPPDTPVQDAPPAPGCPLLIDDMEETFGHINDGCRNGFWFTYNDGADAGAQQPPAGSTFLPTMLVPPRGASVFAAHTGGTGHAFAGMGLNFDSPPAGVTGTYDAGAYAGITFFAMGTGPIFVSLPNRDTNPSGLVCATADRALCNDHFGKTILLSSTWQSYTVLFSELRQQGFGYAPPGGFDKSAVFGVLWQAMGPGAFDIWIDDLAFVVAGDAGSD